MRQLARQFDVTERTVLNWVEYGLPALDIGADDGGVALIPAAEARRWITEAADNGVIRL